MPVPLPLSLSAPAAPPGAAVTVTAAPLSTPAAAPPSVSTAAALPLPAPAPPPLPAVAGSQAVTGVAPLLLCCPLRLQVARLPLLPSLIIQALRQRRWALGLLRPLLLFELPQPALHSLCCIAVILWRAPLFLHCNGSMKPPLWWDACQHGWHNQLQTGNNGRGLAHTAAQRLRLAIRVLGGRAPPGGPAARAIQAPPFLQDPPAGCGRRQTAGGCVQSRRRRPCLPSPAAPWERPAPQSRGPAGQEGGGVEIVHGGDVRLLLHSTPAEPVPASQWSQPGKLLVNLLICLHTSSGLPA